jgi:hypothetical protein
MKFGIRMRWENIDRKTKGKEERGNERKRRRGGKSIKSCQ